MKHYIEITLMDESLLYFLWSLLYAQVHFSLVSLQKQGVSNIGLGFPCYRFDRKTITLGNKLRVFADDAESLSLFLSDLMTRLDKYVPTYQDYYHVKSIKEVPKDCNYVVFARKREQKSKENLAARFARRQNIGYAEAMATLDKYQPKPPLKSPFVLIKSQSSGVRFKCHIERRGADLAKAEFDSYGLGGATPDF